MLPPLNLQHSSKLNSMKSFVLFLVAILSSSLAAFSQESPWRQLYISTTLNPDQAQNGYNYIEVAPDNTIYLLEAEAVSGTFGGEWLLRLKSYDGATWNQHGQALKRNVANNENHLDFVISPDGEIYLGMLDSILHFNQTNSNWDSYYVPEYCGGLSSDENSNIYFIHRVQGASGLIYSDLNIAKFDGGAITLADSLATDIALLPRQVNASNKIVYHGSEIAVTLVAQSSNQLYAFKGDFTSGFEKLEQSAPMNGSTLFVGLGISSSAFDEEGNLVVAHRTGIGTDLAIVMHDEVTDQWIAGDTTGLNALGTGIVRLERDGNGKLHLIYAGDNNRGFLFSYTNGNGWEHIGPKSFWSFTTIASLVAPDLTFDENNDVIFSHGFGNNTVPAQVFQYDPTTGFAELRGDHKQRLGVSAYPNPANDQIWLNHLPAKGEIILCDVGGRVVMKQPFNDEDKRVLDCGNLDSGVYLLHISAGRESQSIRIIIEN